MRGEKALPDHPAMELLIYRETNRGLEHGIRAFATYNGHKRFSIRPFRQPMEWAD